MEITYSALTDVGMKRDHNEDAFMVDPKYTGFAVCDGMGGHAAGEVASVVAEDRDGWFGIRPGRADLVALLPAGLLVFRDPGPEGAEGFVALSGGVLDLAGSRCRVLAGDAVLSRSLEDIGARNLQYGRR